MFLSYTIVKWQTIELSKDEGGFNLMRDRKVLCISLIEYKPTSPPPSSLPFWLSSLGCQTRPPPSSPLQSFFWHSPPTTVCSTVYCQWSERSAAPSRNSPTGSRKGRRKRKKGNRRSDDYTAIKVHVKGRSSKEERVIFCLTFTNQRPNSEPEIF